MALRRILVMAATLIMASQGYANIIYGVNRNVGAASVVGTITTNGSLGALGYDDILAFSLTLADTTYSVDIDYDASDIPGSTGGLHFVSSGNPPPPGDLSSPLSATASQLLFDFTSAGYVHFQLDDVDDATPFWCLAGSASTPHCVSFIGGESIKTSKTPAVSYTTTITGSQVMANAIPEPGTLVLLGAGLLGLAGSMRKRAT